MINETVDIILTGKREMTGKPIILMCNKGDGDRKQGGASFVKLLARWSEEATRVRVTPVGIETAGNTTKSGADVIDEQSLVMASVQMLVVVRLETILKKSYRKRYKCSMLAIILSQHVHCMH